MNIIDYLDEVGYFSPGVFNSTGAVSGGDSASASPAARRPSGPGAPDVNQTAPGGRVVGGMQQSHVTTRGAVNTFERSSATTTATTTAAAGRRRRCIVMDAPHQRGGGFRSGHVTGVCCGVVRILFQGVVTL